jgi:hypothetical protein
MHARVLEANYESGGGGNLEKIFEVLNPVRSNA